MLMLHCKMLVVRTFLLAPLFRKKMEKCVVS